MRISGALIDRALASVPAAVTLVDRAGDPQATLGADRSYVASGHNAIYILPDEGPRRPISKTEVADFTRLADALPYIDLIGVQAMPQDVMPEASLLHGVDATFRNTTSHMFFSPESRPGAEAIFAMARAVAGTDDLANKPIVTCQLSSTSPLTWETGAVEALISTARAGVPCCLLPQPYAGVTAPITLAGLLTVHNAEVLSGIVIAQLVRPGLPMIYGSAWTTFEMKEAHVMLGTPEAALLRIAGAQMARYYHVPYHTTGPDSEPHVHDEQNGWERMMTLIAALGGGVDLLVNAGMFASGMTVSFEQLVMDNEMVGIVRRLLAGMAITEESLAVDSIDHIGPGGNFMMEDDTLRHLRSGEHWEKIVSNRAIYEKWRLRGEPDIVANARRHARDLLASHRVPPLPPATQSRLDEIIRAFEARLR